MVLNLFLITTLTIYDYAITYSMQQKTERLGKKQSLKKTVETQGNYTNFKQKVAENENFVIPKVNHMQQLLDKCRPREAAFLKLTTRVIRKEIRKSGNKSFSQKSRVFVLSFFSKLN